MTNRFTLVVLGGLLGLAGVARGQAFAPVVTYSAGASSFPYAVAVADVNGDGKPDLLTANESSSTAGVLLGTGPGTFGAAATYSTGPASFPYGLVVADVNADGRPDLLTANYGGDAVGVLLNVGAGAFGPVAAYSTGANSVPYGVAVADVNGDGKPDIITANYSNNTVGVLLGTGTGTFGVVAAYNTGANSAPYAIAVADVNGDGKPDLLTANYGAGAVGVLLGTGVGTFGTVVPYGTGAGSGPVGLAVADLNHDGRPDVCTANYTTNKVGVLLGLGSGTFGPVAAYDADGAPETVAIADLNKDGKPDLVVANYGTSTTVGNSVGVLLGTGTGTFTPMSLFHAGNNSRPLGLAVADVNGDGKPDVITANSGSNTVGVLLNTTVLATHAALPGASASLSPNPATDHTALTLAGLPATVARVQATLLDATGRTVGQLLLAATQGGARAELPTAGLAGGLYVLRLAAYDGRGELAGSLPTQRLSVR